VDILTKIKHLFVRANIPTKLIYINVGIFILIRLIVVLFTLFQIEGINFLQYLQMPSSYGLFIYRPWTVVTYMFVHYDVLHILFNMLWLYWFGRIFMQFFTVRHFGGLYVSGGIVGALFFLLAYNIFPYFRNVVGFSYLMGASASVMAIVFAAAFYRKDTEINLLFIGRIKLIYLALFALVVDLLSVVSANAGGHIAHIGGALFGILFATQLQRGKDLTVSVNRVIDRLVNIKKRRKSKMKVTYKRPVTDAEYNMRKRNEEDAIDAILDKLKHFGYQNLSSEEKKALFDASKK
jgi:membrane associated rhomboid family serine protease